MTFESFAGAQSALLWSAFAIAVIMGAVVNKTNFCTMGAVSDVVNMGDTGRFRAWLLAIAIAMLGVVILESAGLANANQAFPPYRANTLLWAENLLGGLMFGIGMTLASGCGNKTLIRLGAGNLKSLVVFAIIGVIAYFMVYPFPGSDQTLMSLLFLDWLRPLAIQLPSQQDIGSLVSAKSAVTIRLVVGLVLAAALLVFIFRSADFRGSRDNLLGGIVVGVAVVGAWYISSNIRVDVDGETHTLASYAQQWDFLAESDAGKPAEVRTLSPQSFTFINPIGQTAGFVGQGFPLDFVSFGMMAVFGVMVGSLVWALLSGGFRIEWFASGRDFLNHLIGAILMGFGGVMAMGCTIGQGITGISTLAVGSFIAFISIVLGSALTMKVQYYRMVYEEEATFWSALVTGLVDLHLLPASMRKLEAI